MDQHPLRLTTPVKQHVFGGRALAGRLGRCRPARTPRPREVSDVDGECSSRARRRRPSDDGVRRPARSRPDLLLSAALGEVHVLGPPTS